MKMVII